MSELRFKVGDAVMCNLGPDGWKLGQVIALHYREAPWPPDQAAPYQVALEEDHTLIYVPADDARLCRAPTPEDLRIARRPDALAALPDGDEPAGRGGAQLGCAGPAPAPGSAGYRDGRCRGCACCPRGWSAVELYSEHYRCAARNGLRVTRRRVDLGTVRVGGSMPVEGQPGHGFLQCPTLVRLPPGVRFSDAGALSGTVRFDPHRDATYRVNFVAVSTAAWEDVAVGIVRLEVAFIVEGNAPPAGFDVSAFRHAQAQARTEASRLVHQLGDLWEQWERGELGHRATCDRMGAELHRLRELLERHPRLDGGRWWARLGGFHMNVHKLLENTLFECELYLGHALSFGSAEVRSLAEANLEGCYQKRLLEAARFLWIESLERMMRGEWAAAIALQRRAAAKKDGWGWAVNHGDVWISEAAARLVHGATLSASGDAAGAQWIAEVAPLLDRAAPRAAEALGPGGHPWAAEIGAALLAYRDLEGGDAAAWLEAFRARTVVWCALALGGAAPFPPQPRPRQSDAAQLDQRVRALHGG
ncbi:MAG: hypothetical protein AAGH15_18195 [Myxococcota bacterium]